MIVAIESASTDPSLAIAEADGATIGLDAWSSDRPQGGELLPRLIALLERHGYRLAQATAVAVGRGPGSFTGLRVGMSLAKGLALALNRPLVGVPSLEAWLEADREAPAALTRAGARQAYLLLRGEEAIRIVDREALPSEATTASVVAPIELTQAFGLAGARSPGHAAAAVAALAAARLAGDPAGDDVARLEPIYLRAPRGVGQVAHAEVTPWR